MFNALTYKTHLSAHQDGQQNSIVKTIIPEFELISNLIKSISAILMSFAYRFKEFYKQVFI